MKILKKPSGIIYNTLDIDSREYNPFKGFGNPIPLHHFRTDNKTDFEFLSEYFPKGHPIFIDFVNSYFYYLSV